MSGTLLRTFNFHFGTRNTAKQTIDHVRSLQVLPIPNHLSLLDWRAHVPMPLLESWDDLSDDECVALYVMGHCATHGFEHPTCREYPAMN